MRNWRTYLLFVLLLCIAVPCRAQQREIVIHSKNFIGYKELVGGRASSSVNITGFLSIPIGIKSKVPAVVFLPHSGGYSDFQERWYRNALNVVGIATLFIDNYSPRGLGRPSVGRHPSFATFVADAYAALIALSNEEAIDVNRVALAGFSRGAEATRLAASEVLRRGAGAGELRFAAHIALYPACVANLREFEYQTRTPVMLLLGDKDNVTPARICQEYVTFMKGLNPTFPVETRLYVNAEHGWDDWFTGPAPENGSVEHCRPLFITSTGEYSTMIKNGVEVAFDTSMLSCAGGKGTLAFSAAARARSTSDLVGFLKLHLLGGT